MRIDVFDVGHGGCALITAPDGTRIMLDCGFNGDRRWFPSVEFIGQRIDALVALNLDEDHLCDLPHVWRTIRIGGVLSNPTVPALALESMKPQGMREGVSKMHELLPHFSNGWLGSMPGECGGVRGWYYCNRYGQFFDTNNLSLAVFVRYGDFTALFAGDLLKAGWRSLMQMPSFIRDLATVNVLIASHHGRESGCCPEVFHVARPDIVIFSDCDIRHESQQTVGWYGQRAKGIIDLSSAPDRYGRHAIRKVLTTRTDGSINITVPQFGYYNVETERSLSLARLANALLPSAPIGLDPSGSLLAAMLARLAA